MNKRKKERISNELLFSIFRAFIYFQEIKKRKKFLKYVSENYYF